MKTAAVHYRYTPLSAWCGIRTDNLPATDDPNEVTCKKCEKHAARDRKRATTLPIALGLLEDQLRTALNNHWADGRATDCAECVHAAAIAAEIATIKHLNGAA